MSRLLCKVKLSKGKYSLVDPEDYERVMQHRWQYNGGYARRTIYLGRKNKKSLYDYELLHHFITGVKGDDRKIFVTDHINRDKLDNRKSNLRRVSSSENSLNRGKNKNNSSGFKGVSYHGIGNKNWRARVSKGGKRITLGLFKTPKEAAKAISIW